MNQQHIQLDILPTTTAAGSLYLRQHSIIKKVNNTHTHTQSPTTYIQFSANLLSGSCPQIKYKYLPISPSLWSLHSVYSH